MLNERACNALAAGLFEGLLLVSVCKKGKETKVECVVQGLIPISQYFSGMITKKTFLDFAFKVALQIKNCEKNMINVNNLDLQSDRIFIEPQTKRIKCVCWPIVNNQKGIPPHVFLKQLPQELRFDPSEDAQYLSVYNAFFGGMQPFSVNGFERMLNMISSRASAGKSTVPSGQTTDHATCPSGTGDKKRTAVAYDPLSREYEQVVMQHYRRETAFAPTLVCLKTQELYKVDKSVFKIGTKKELCDLCIGDNRFVSKRHADIVSRERKYYIVDHNSTNKTFVNDTVIPPEKEIEIVSGTKLRFANEEYVFTIR